MKTALAIAGSDCSGGAGIQADIKTMTCCGVYGMSAVTALTAQNTTGVKAIMQVDADFLRAQIECVITDIFPDAVKIGMVSSAELIEVIADSIKKFSLKNVVLDPVMVATSGASLIDSDAVEVLQKKLIPLASVITPNIPEAQVLCGMKINSACDMEKAAGILYEKYSCAVLLKGGHSLGDANDFLYDGGNPRWFSGKRIENPNTHGTGCTLSSAIASFLAKGMCLEDSVREAKNYLCGALNAMLNLGKGSGPLAHNWNFFK